MLGRHLGGWRVVGLVIGDIRCPAIMGSVRTLSVVEFHSVADPVSGLKSAAPCVQVDAFVFQ